MGDEKSYRDLLLADFKLARGSGTVRTEYEALAALADAWAALIEQKERACLAREATVERLRGALEYIAEHSGQPHFGDCVDAEMYIRQYARQALEESAKEQV